MSSNAFRFCSAPFFCPLNWRPVEPYGPHRRRHCLEKMKASVPLPIENVKYWSSDKKAGAKLKYQYYRSDRRRRRSGQHIQCSILSTGVWDIFTAQRHRLLTYAMLLLRPSSPIRARPPAAARQYADWYRRLEAVPGGSRQCSCDVAHSRAGAAPAMWRAGGRLALARSRRAALGGQPATGSGTRVESAIANSLLGLSHRLAPDLSSPHWGWSSPTFQSVVLFNIYNNIIYRRQPRGILKITAAAKLSCWSLWLKAPDGESAAGYTYSRRREHATFHLQCWDAPIPPLWMWSSIKTLVMPSANETVVTACNVPFRPV